MYIYIALSLPRSELHPPQMQYMTKHEREVMAIAERRSPAWHRSTTGPPPHPKPEKGFGLRASSFGF